jgi:DNA primase
MTYDIAPLLDKYEIQYNPERGGNQQVRCAFHEDGTASASVNLDEGLYNCFTCGIGGDAIELIKIVEGASFGDAKRIVEDLAGENRPAVSRQSDAGGSFLPRRTSSRPGRRIYKSPWARKRA